MQRISIRVVANARKNSVEQEENGRLKVRVTAAAVEGKANKAVIDLLAAHFGIKKSAIILVRGEKSRDKILEIDD
jgi:uncharacterized protein (TIGR00251 family)